MLDGDVVVEEKLDGANLGVSVSPDGEIRVQNRGQYLIPPYDGQFARLETWLAPREESLFDSLGDRFILFGEWCAARHSLEYDRLPDWFLAFDVYDRNVGKFWSTARRDALVRELRLEKVPEITRGRLSLAQLREMVLTRAAAYRSGPLEGVVVRRESGDWLEERAKMVRPGFVQAIGEHWRRRTIEWNRVYW